MAPGCFAKTSHNTLTAIPRTCGTTPKIADLKTNLPDLEIKPATLIYFSKRSKNLDEFEQQLYEFSLDRKERDQLP